MALKQYLQFKLSQKLSPQQIQLMKLIQLPTQAFEQRLKQELEENPALDTGKENEAKERQQQLLKQKIIDAQIEKEKRLKAIKDQKEKNKIAKERSNNENNERGLMANEDSLSLKLNINMNLSSPVFIILKLKTIPSTATSSP